MKRWQKIRNGIINSFKGGIFPKENKESSSKTLSAKEYIPSRLVLPLLQHSGSPAEVLVKEGQHVKAYEPLTRPKLKYQVPIHAPVSGTIESISMQNIAHPSGLKEPCIVLISDPEDKQEKMEHPKFENFEEQSVETLLKHINDMGVAGLGGAGFPTEIKLRSSVSKNHCELLIVNGAECEPYITCDDRLMQERSDQIAIGIKILQYILEPKYTVIAIEANKREAMTTLNKAIIDNDVANTRITELPVKYPSGAARNLIKLITDIEIPYSARSTDYGVVVHNVSTIYSIAEAVTKGIPLVKRLVTITGQALDVNENCWTYIGTSIKELILKHGYTKQKFPRIIVGGPMMGFTLHQADVPIIKTISCVIAPSDKELVTNKITVNCIRCGRCAKVCPSRLVPYELYGYCLNEKHGKALNSGLKSCIECGSCSYVCPSAIQLVAEFRKAKAQIKAEKAKENKLRVTQSRFETKKTRIAEEERQRALRKAEALRKAKLLKEQNDAKKLEEAKNKEATVQVQAQAENVNTNTLKNNEIEKVKETTSNVSTLNIEEILAKPNSELTPEEKELKKKYALQKAMELKAQREAQKNADNSKKETK